MLPAVYSPLHARGVQPVLLPVLNSLGTARGVFPAGN